MGRLLFFILVLNTMVRPALAAGVAAAFSLRSSAFADGAPIPARFTSDGEDVSPPLQWSGTPARTRELVLICDDPDAPGGTSWVHWMIYQLSAKASSLPEGVPTQKVLTQPVHALQGRNSFGKTGYGGPQPPPGNGWHHYFFKLYALDAPLSLGPGASKEDLLKAMKGHELAQAQLMGRYQR